MTDILGAFGEQAVEIEVVGGLDTDGDGLPDTLDFDDDDDGCEDPVDLFPLTFSPDADGDGFGDDCDCDDGNAIIFPGAPAIIDGVDNDCEGVPDN